MPRLQPGLSRRSVAKTDQFGRRAIGAVKIGFAPGFRDDAKDLTQRRKDAKMSFPLYWGIWFHNLPLQSVGVL